MRNEIGFVIENVPDIPSRTAQIQEVMINHNYDVQKKQLGSAAFGVGFVAVIAYMLARLGNEPVPIHVQVLPDQAKQISAAMDAAPTPTAAGNSPPRIAIIQTNAKDPGSLLTITLIDEPASTSTSAPDCPDTPVRLSGLLSVLS